MSAVFPSVIQYRARAPRRLTAIILTMVLAAPAHSAIVYVRFDALPGGNGASWATAYRHINTALAASGPNDEIWVARGAYFPDESPAFPTGSGDRTATFHVDGNRKLIGGFAGTESSSTQRDVELNPTILCGDLNQNDGPGFLNCTENSYNVVDTTGSTAAALIDGFVISAGYGDESLQGPHSVGAGIFGSYPPGAPGLAMIRNCRIQSNFVLEDGAAAYGHNGGFVNCVIADNFAGDVGGGLANCAGPVVNCVIAGNEAFAGAALFGCNGSIQNCLIARNTAILGAISGGSGSLQNCTVTGHQPAEPVIRFFTGSITNCIVFGNAGPSFNSSSTPSYSCIQGGSAGVGNISANPRFADADGPDNDPESWKDNDYRLLLISPCIDAANSSALLGDAGDLDQDGDVTEPIPLDLRGAMRRAEILSVPNSGVGASPVVDMGAFEAHCPGDLNGDGGVALDDLAILLSHFGLRPALYVEGDLNADGAVDLADLALLLSNFGSTC